MDCPIVGQATVHRISGVEERLERAQEVKWGAKAWTRGCNCEPDHHDDDVVLLGGVLADQSLAS